MFHLFGSLLTASTPENSTRMYCSFDASHEMPFIYFHIRHSISINMQQHWNCQRAETLETVCKSSGSVSTAHAQYNQEPSANAPLLSCAPFNAIWFCPLLIFDALHQEFWSCRSARELSLHICAPTGFGVPSSTGCAYPRKGVDCSPLQRNCIQLYCKS